MKNMLSHFILSAPYVSIRMNPVVEGDSAGLAYKDAIFFSVHKFIGGVQTTGGASALHRMHDFRVALVDKARS